MLVVVVLLESLVLVEELSVVEVLVVLLLEVLVESERSADKERSPAFLLPLLLPLPPWVSSSDEGSSPSGS